MSPMRSYMKKKRSPICYRIWVIFASHDSCVYTVSYQTFICVILLIHMKLSTFLSTTFRLLSILFILVQSFLPGLQFGVYINDAGQVQVVVDVEADIVNANSYGDHCGNFTDEASCSPQQDCARFEQVDLCAPFLPLSSCESHHFATQCNNSPL